MARALVLTVIGKDRPGLVKTLADLIAKHEGNWDESRMARLAGHFAGVVQIQLPENQAEDFITALPMLADHGLSVSVVDSNWSLVNVDHHNALQLEVVDKTVPGSCVRFPVDCPLWGSACKTFELLSRAPPCQENDFFGPRLSSSYPTTPIPNRSAVFSSDLPTR